MASFQGKIVWKRQRKRENKIIVSFRPYLTHNLKFQKKCKKIQKIKKTRFGVIFSQISAENNENERK